MTSLGNRLIMAAAHRTMPLTFNDFARDCALAPTERLELRYHLDALVETGDLDRSFNPVSLALYSLGAHHHHSVMLARHDRGVRLSCRYCDWEDLRQFPLSLHALFNEFGALRA